MESIQQLLNRGRFTYLRELYSNILSKLLGTKAASIKIVTDTAGK